MDPRISIVPERIKNIKRKIAVVSGKGGVGKTVIASLLALELSSMGKIVGLLDLDFNGPSCHIVLGIPEDTSVEEEKGIIPPLFNGIRFMSLELFVKGRALPLRGNDISNAIIELLAITRWGSLDYLIIDTPPGTSDELLDILRLIDGLEALIVTIPSKLALKTVERLLDLLKMVNTNIIGIVENMSKGTDIVREFAKRFNIRYLGSIPYDEKLEGALGDVGALKRTNVSESIITILHRIIGLKITR